jgi:hypothetical protein
LLMCLITPISEGSVSLPSWGQTGASPERS